MRNSVMGRPLLAVVLAMLAISLMAARGAAAAPERWQPEPGLRWQLQFTGEIDLSVPADVFDLDLFDTSAAMVRRIHAQGDRAICYINAGAWENWRPDKDRYPAAVKGRPLDGWPGERWLDVRRLDVLGPILRDRIALCRARGFDGIEFDNVDGYANRSGFPLTGDDQLRFNRWLARAAHRAGLAVGLKNDLDQIPQLAPVFDFAINEECWSFQECGAMRPFRSIGKPVLVIEYGVPLEEFCPTVRRLRYEGIRKRLKLDAAVWRC